jgi:hypothetical protein
VDNRAGGCQADAAAAGALLVDDDEVEDDEVDDDPESDFFDESDEEEPLASPVPLDVDESADTFSLPEPSVPEPPDALARLSVR